MSDKCPMCGSETPSEIHGMTGMLCDSEWHDEPAQEPAEQSAVERARANRFLDSIAGKLTQQECDLLDALIAAERADAVKGMHAAGCECRAGQPWKPGECTDMCAGPSDPIHQDYTDPRCLAARKEAADGK